MPINSITMNRRHFLGQLGVGAGLASALNGADPPKLIDNPKGNFRFRRGGGTYSSGGTVAMKDYEIVHATFSTMVPLAKALDRIDAYLERQGRPPQAVCGIELRSPKPFTFAEFGQLSKTYVDLLTKHNLMVGEVNPVARVNVAPELDPPAEVSIYGFSYTAPQPAARPTFLAASGELSGPYPQGIVARGDTSVNGLRQKVTRELENLDRTLRELEVGWSGVNNLVVYSVHNIHPLLRELLLPRLGAAKNFGIRWYYCRPPLEELEIELQVRGCDREVVI